MFGYYKKRKMPKGEEIEDSIMTITRKEAAIIERPFKRKGLSIIWYFILISLIVLISRVFYLDYVRGKYYTEVSRENRIRLIITKAPRGNIFDKFGKALARNIPSLDAIIIPNNLPETSQERKEMAKILARALDMDQGNVEIILDSQDLKSPLPMLLKENITQEQALILSEKFNELRGIEIDTTAIRNYEDSVIFSHVLGYDGKITQEERAKNQDYLMTDYIGKTGVEKSYEKELRGMYGARQVEIDSMGNIKKYLGSIEPQPGSDLFLNIDEELQKKLYDSLSTVLEKSGTRTAAAVAIDPRTGGVLALVSFPSYDNNMFAGGITNEEYKNLIGDKGLPLFNRVVAGEYPPGSTLKPAIALAALSEGTVTPETTVNCTGAIQVGTFRFGDWKTHGTVDMRKAIAESCDVYFYSLGGGYAGIPGLGMSRMKKYENLFGFGEPTGIDLTGEAKGFIPDESWKLEKIKEKWYIGDSYHSAIGQGFVSTTPLQLANYTAALANGGTLYSPRVVNRIKKNNGEEIHIDPKIIRKNFIPEEFMKIVREGMRETIISGSARSLASVPVAVAGKTGTAQFGTEERTHGWFISFAPFENPTIAMVVLVEGGGEGSSSAVPVTKEVYDWYFNRNK